MYSYYFDRLQSLKQSGNRSPLKGERLGLKKQSNLPVIVGTGALAAAAASILSKKNKFRNATLWGLGTSAATAGGYALSDAYKTAAKNNGNSSPLRGERLGSEKDTPKADLKETGETVQTPAAPSADSSTNPLPPPFGGGNVVVPPTDNPPKPLRNPQEFYDAALKVRLLDSLPTTKFQDIIRTQRESEGIQAVGSIAKYEYRYRSKLQQERQQELEQAAEAQRRDYNYRTTESYKNSEQAIQQSAAKLQWLSDEESKLNAKLKDPAVPADDKEGYFRQREQVIQARKELQGDLEGAQTVYETLKASPEIRAHYNDLGNDYAAKYFSNLTAENMSKALGAARSMRMHYKLDDPFVRMSEDLVTNIPPTPEQVKRTAAQMGLSLNEAALALHLGADRYDKNGNPVYMRHTEGIVNTPDGSAASWAAAAGDTIMSGLGRNYDVPGYVGWALNILSPHAVGLTAGAAATQSLTPYVSQNYELPPEASIALEGAAPVLGGALGGKYGPRLFRKLLPERFVKPVAGAVTKAAPGWVTKAVTKLLVKGVLPSITFAGTNASALTLSREDLAKRDRAVYERAHELFPGEGNATKRMLYLQAQNFAATGADALSYINPAVFGTFSNGTIAEWVPRAVYSATERPSEGREDKFRRQYLRELGLQGVLTLRDSPKGYNPKLEKLKEQFSYIYGDDRLPDPDLMDFHRARLQRAGYTDKQIDDAFRNDPMMSRMIRGLGW